MLQHIVHNNEQFLSIAINPVPVSDIVHHYELFVIQKRYNFRFFNQSLPFSDYYDFI